MLVENIEYQRFVVELVVAGRRRQKTVWSPGTPWLGQALTGVLEQAFPAELAAGAVRVVSVHHRPYRVRGGGQ